MIHSLGEKKWGGGVAQHVEDAEPHVQSVTYKQSRKNSVAGWAWQRRLSAYGERYLSCKLPSALCIMWPFCHFQHLRECGCIVNEASPRMPLLRRC